MLRFLRAARFGRWEITFAELAFEQFQRHGVGLHGEGGIVARAFVAEEGVLAVEFVPGKISAGIGQGVVHDCPALARTVRVLAAPNH